MSFPFLESDLGGGPTGGQRQYDALPEDKVTVSAPRVKVPWFGVSPAVDVAAGGRAPFGPGHRVLRRTD